MAKFTVCFFLSTLSFTQTNPRAKKSTSSNAVCPLSDSLVQKSVKAFQPIAHVMQTEPRCVNCHGGVNPFMEGVDPEHSMAIAVHGGGKMDPPAFDPNDGSKMVSSGTDCDSCHDSMAPKRNGGASKWEIPDSDDFFVGQDERSLCEHMKRSFQEAKDFIGHLKDDNGIDNFVGTAFNGNRGLTVSAQDKGFKLEPPVGISHAGLIALGGKWSESTGGEFKGDTDCGCNDDPPRYAIRLSQSTEIAIATIHHTSFLKQLEVPITFEDDGTFSGDAEGAYEASGTAAGCNEQSTTKVKFHITGQAIEQYQKNSMHIEIEYPSPLANSFSGVCPDDPEGNLSLQSDIPVMGVKSAFDMKGKVGEKIDRVDETMPGIVSSFHLEIVQKN